MYLYLHGAVCAVADATWMSAQRPYVVTHFINDNTECVGKKAVPRGRSEADFSSSLLLLLLHTKKIIISACARCSIILHHWAKKAPRTMDTSDMEYLDRAFDKICLVLLGSFMVALVFGYVAKNAASLFALCHKMRSIKHRLLGLFLLLWQSYGVLSFQYIACPT